MGALAPKVHILLFLLPPLQAGKEGDLITMYRDVGVRYLTGDRHPDHDTICRFRRENSEAFGEAFLEVLKLAREAGLLRVGTVGVDGSKIRANASKQ